MKTKFCCKEFAEQAGEYQAPVGGGLYPGLQPDSQFEISPEDNEWAINGCCGGGCYVVTNMKFCPYCGSNLNEFKEEGNRNKLDKLLNPKVL